jgi:DNA repair protein SbcC/Rad50
MRLLTLRLRQFRQFAEAEFAFEDGLTVINGGNGTGKSTLLEAILWALYGAHAVRRSEASLRRTGAPAGAATESELHFALPAGAFVLHRSLGADDGASADATLMRADGEVLAAGVSATEEAVSALLGADRAQMLHVCVTGRKELQHLTQLRPAERLRMLARLLGRRVARDAGVQHASADEIAALERELAEADERMHALQTAPELLAQYTAELDRLRPELESVEANAERLHDEWSQKRQDVDTKLETYRRRSDELRLQIERLAAAGDAGSCPTCAQPLGAHVAALLTRLDEEVYAAAQDTKWLLQRRSQLGRKPPDLAEAETRRARLRSTVDDRAERAARCEQEMQELWTVAGEQKRTAERLELLRAAAPAARRGAAGQPLAPADLARIAATAGAYLERITGGMYDSLALEADGRVHAYLDGTAAPVVSGGDEDLIALVLRLATMGEAAAGSPHLDLLLLDEPFGAMDAVRVQRAAALLLELGSERPQRVIATRSDTLRRHADRLIEL